MYGVVSICKKDKIFWRKSSGEDLLVAFICMKLHQPLLLYDSKESCCFNAPNQSRRFYQ